MANFEWMVNHLKVREKKKLGFRSPAFCCCCHVSGSQLVQEVCFLHPAKYQGTQLCLSRTPLPRLCVDIFPPSCPFFKDPYSIYLLRVNVFSIDTITKPIVFSHVISVNTNSYEINVGGCFC